MKTCFIATTLIVLFFQPAFSACLSQGYEVIPVDEPPISGETIEVNEIPGHPRLLLLEGEEKGLKKFINSELCWLNVHNQIIAASEKMVTEPVAERVLTGRRLLDVSRSCLRRIFFLSYSYRTTGDKTYAKRAQEEMLAVCNFSDWNPSHFLDVAEMAFGISIGYDWLYDYLSPEARTTISKALFQKAIEPSMDSRYNNFLTAESNWSQVCNTGMLYAALAVLEDHPDMCEQIIERSIASLYMGDYEPEGVYAEGVGYWSYGTSYNVLFISALEKTFGTDFGLSSRPGVDRTAHYAQHMIAPDGRIFNYSDSDQNARAGLYTAMFWFASKYDDPSLLWTQKEYLEGSSLGGNRTLPALLIWSCGLSANDIKAPAERMFYGQGKNPVAVMRTSWTNANALYLGLKAGTANLSHGHMDIGSFVFVANGVRWAEDLGMQEYNSLESLGMNIWNYSQDSDRWNVFRYNNRSHNTLIVDDRLQESGGYSIIDRAGENERMMFTVSDISASYASQLQAVQRGVAIVDESYAVIRDEITAPDKPSTVRWNMATRATVEEISGNRMILKKDGRRLIVRVDYPSDTQLRTWPGEGPNSWDAPNDGVTFIGFEHLTGSRQDEVLQVSLIPYLRNDNKYIFDRPIADW